MKINKIGIKIILVMILIVICNSCICYAKLPDYQPATKGDATDTGEGGETNEQETSTTVEGDKSLGLPSLEDEGYRPSIDAGETTISIISKILGVLTVLGVVAIVISIAIMGFGSILGSASEKAVGQEKMVGIVIAAALITGGSIIARMIISVAENM